MATRRTPAYQRLADALRERIEAGEFPPGWQLPSEAQLISTYGASNTTVRAAVRLLGAQGVTETRQGSGTFVAARHRQALPVTGAGIWPALVLSTVGLVPAGNPTCQIVTADAADAEAFEIVEGDPVIVHRTCWSTADRPAAITTTRYPQSVTTVVPQLAVPQPAAPRSAVLRPTACQSAAPEAPVPENPVPEDPRAKTSGPDVEPADAVEALLAAAGYRIARHYDRVATRQPAPDEADYLELPLGMAVLVHRRTSAGPLGRPAIRTIDSVYRGDLFELAYDLPADAPLG